jgi:hypothetical protein
MPRGNGGVIGPANIPTTTSAKGVWSLMEQFLAQRQGIWPSAAGADPYFEYTTLLLPGNGTNGAQNNTFLDASTNNFTITRNGNTTQGTFSPFSQTGWGAYFDGSNDYLTTTLASAVTSTYTIDFWICPTSVAAGDKTILNIHTTASNTAGLVIKRNGSQIQVNDGNTAGTGPSGGTLAVGTWTFVTLVCNGTNTVLYINGTSVNTYSGVTLNGSPTYVHVGAFGDLGVGSYVDAYISNLRVIVGSANTPSATPPTTPSTAVTNTKLLTLQSNRFVDNSGSNLTITPVNGTAITPFSPFAPTSSYSAAAVGGSGYFDGSGDYLSAPSSSAFAVDSVFTIEFWLYPTAYGANPVFIFLGETSGSLQFGLNSGNIAVAASGVAWRLTSSTPPVLNSWNHIVLVRSGTGSNQTSIFLNGNRIANGTVTDAWTTNTTAIIQSTQNSSYLTTGWMSSIRIVKGTAVYDPTQTTLTVPTAPLTAITNTSLLLNFTNSGIYDATSKNDLETVGNAQISTTQSKWGGSSMSFDGTGDWLLIPDQPIQRIGTGNFTVEGWVYRNSSGTYGLIGKGTGTTGWLVSLNSSNQVVFTYGSSTITSTGTVSATTWTHIAVVREGTSTNQTKIYINGTNDGTGTVSTDFNQTNSMYVGADRTGGSAANAYMQDVRVTNYARYTSNFTAPTAAFPTL